MIWDVSKLHLLQGSKVIFSDRLFSDFVANIKNFDLEPLSLPTLSPPPSIPQASSYAAALKGVAADDIDE